ncbi:hypothetical protein M0804_009791 [Polistes exclamans]|nr:hypothetical protein M0804_009791 [Polistes exclamans]
MADSRLSEVLRLLWKNFQKGISIENSATEFLSKDYFEYPDVCFALIDYWYTFFYWRPSRFSNEFALNFITLEERLFFLSTLLRDHTTWTTPYYMDALKVSRGTIFNYMARLDHIHCPQGWIHRKELQK